MYGYCIQCKSESVAHIHYIVKLTKFLSPSLPKCTAPRNNTTHTVSCTFKGMYTSNDDNYNYTMDLVYITTIKHLTLSWYTCTTAM